AARPGGRRSGGRDARPPRGVRPADGRPWPGRTGRGSIAGRGRVRRRRAVPGTGKVRAAGVDGLQGRAVAGSCRRDGGVAVSEATSAKASVEDLEEALKDVVDPELGINVVDLGLVYGLHVDDDNVATIDMTLTSAACPLTDVIEDQTNQALAGL